MKGQMLMGFGLVMMTACTDGGFGLNEARSWIEGRVVDDNGAPVEGVPVFLVRDRVAEQSVQTDARGRFRIGPSISGDIELVVNGGYDRGAWQAFEVPADGALAVPPLVLEPMAHRTDLLYLQGVGYEECMAEVEPLGPPQFGYGPNWRIWLDPEDPDVGLAVRWRSEDSMSGMWVNEYYRWDAEAETVLTPMPELTLAHHSMPHLEVRGRIAIVQNDLPDQLNVMCRFFDLRHGRLVHEVMDREHCVPSDVLSDEDGFTLTWLGLTSSFIERMDWDGRSLERLEPERGNPPTGWQVLYPRRERGWLLMAHPSCNGCETTAVIAVDQRTLERRDIGEFPEPRLNDAWWLDGGARIVGTRTDRDQSIARVWLHDTETEPRLIYESACRGTDCPRVRAVIESEDVLLLTEPETPGFLALDLTTFEVMPYAFPGLDGAVNRGCVENSHQECLVSQSEDRLRLVGLGISRTQDTEIVNGRVTRTLEYHNRELPPMPSNDGRWEGAGWTRADDLHRQIYVASTGGDDDDFQPVTFLSFRHYMRGFSMDGRWAYAEVEHPRCSMTRIPLP